MSEDIKPLEATKFLKALPDYYSSDRGTKLYDMYLRDHKQKLEIIGDAGYGAWLRHLLPYLINRYSLRGKKVLDLGCGTGELVVRMNRLGYETVGIDMDEEKAALAQVLAVENGLAESTFVKSNAERLPFADNSFDIITMFSVLEHVDDQVLIKTLLPELERICGA